MGIAIEWIARHRPLDPGALWAPRAVVPALARRLADADDLSRWRGVATADGWVIVGEALPWVDGLTYLGRDPDAPGLWIPTLLALSPAAPLVERALTARFGAPPLALWGTPLVVVPLMAARVLDRARVAEAARELG